ncbi:MAG: HAMP domain-containing histidine kinase [bacterium]|nr:HAMP domain-containing histidine kinase [bacterium]
MHVISCSRSHCRRRLVSASKPGRVQTELAHEVGKPLGTLESLARKLRDGKVARESQPDVLESIVRLAGHLRETVRDVLQYGPEEDVSPPIQLTDIVEKALHQIDRVCGSGRVVAHPMPAHPHLPVGSRRLTRVLVNLIDNAIEASGDLRPVVLHARCVDRELLIEVRDRGIGIPRENLQSIMDPFVSLREGGDGLGLSISREIVEGLGGSLEFESCPGWGTTARVRLCTAEASG